MKKIVYLFLLAFALNVLPPGIVHANSMAVPPAAQQHMAHLKEKRDAISERVKFNKKIQTEINKKSKRAADLYQIAFGKGSVPSEADAKKAEMMEAQLGKIAGQSAMVEKQITRKVGFASQAVQQGNHMLAMSIYDSIIALLDKQTDILKRQNEYLQSYVDFLSSLKHK